HEFKKLYDNPSSDCSDNRFRITRMVMSQWPEMLPAELASFLSQWEGSGTWTEEKPQTCEYDNRQVAREWLKNRGLTKPSSGEAFEAVSDVDERTAYLANGGTAQGWDDWQERLTLRREERRSRIEHQRAHNADGDQPVGQQSEAADASPYVRDSYLVSNYKPVRWLVKKLIPLNSVGALYGLPNVGKSFVVFDLASHVSRGREWFGRKTVRGDVLYLFAEGAEGMSGRVKAWADNNDTSGGSVALMKDVPNLFADKQAVKKIVSAARACERESGVPV